jgi:hypothetical protein
MTNKQRPQTREEFTAAFLCDLRKACISRKQADVALRLTSHYKNNGAEPPAPSTISRYMRADKADKRKSRPLTRLFVASCCDAFGLDPAHISALDNILFDEMQSSDKACTQSESELALEREAARLRADNDRLTHEVTKLCSELARERAKKLALAEHISSIQQAIGSLDASMATHLAKRTRVAFSAGLSPDVSLQFAGPKLMVTQFERLPDDLKPEVVNSFASHEVSVELGVAMLARAMGGQVSAELVGPLGNLLRRLVTAPSAGELSTIAFDGPVGWDLVVSACAEGLVASSQVTAAIHELMGSGGFTWLTALVTKILARGGGGQVVNALRGLPPAMISTPGVHAVEEAFDGDLRSLTVEDREHLRVWAEVARARVPSAFVALFAPAS